MDPTFPCWIGLFVPRGKFQLPAVLIEEQSMQPRLESQQGQALPGCRRFHSPGTCRKVPGGFFCLYLKLNPSFPWALSHGANPKLGVVPSCPLQQQVPEQEMLLADKRNCSCLCM